METVTFQSVRVKANTLFTGKAAPTTDDSASLATFINARTREFWEAYFWPELLRVERRTFRPQYAAANTYAAGDEVYYPAPNLYYLALRNVPVSQPPTDSTGVTLNKAYWAESLECYRANEWSATTAYVAGDAVYQPIDGRFYQAHTAGTNHSPPNASFWGELIPFVRSLDLVGGNQGDEATTIGTVKHAWESDPRVIEWPQSQRVDRYASYVVVRGGVQVVWLEFRLRATDFSGDNWVDGDAYTVGDQVYDPSSGDYYVCVSDTSSVEPGTDDSFWTRLEFPRVLKEAVAQAAYGDMLKLAGKGSKFDSEYQEALRLLRREWMKLERMEGQTGPLNVQTR